MVINDYRASAGGNSRPRALASSERGQASMGEYYGSLAQSFKFAPYSPDALIASKGYKVLDEMQFTAACYAPLSTLRDAILYKNWKVIPFSPDSSLPPPPQAQKLADALTYALSEIADEFGNQTDFRHVLRELTYAFHVGFRVTEKFWKMFEDGPYKGKWGWSEFSAKPAQQIGYDLDPMTFKVRRITSYSPLQGYQFDILNEKVIRYTHGIQDGLPYGFAAGRVAYKNTWSIDFLTKFWNFCLEKFGSPFVLATAPKNSLDAAASVLTQIKNGSYGILPEGTVAQMFQVAAGGLSAYNEAVTWHSQQCALVYLKNVLTSNEGDHGSTSAGSDVQQDTQEYGLAGLRWDIEGVINRQIVRPFLLYNFGPSALVMAPRLSLGDVDEEDASKWAGAMGTLIDKGVLHPADPQITDKLKLKPTPPELQAELKANRQREQQAAGQQEKERAAKAAKEN